MGTYNEKVAVGRVLESIAEATEDAAEIVCVDGSSDCMPDIARGTA